MVANILILAYLALMAYWWGVQGLYYAILHLLSVIVAGALALALWEPLAVSWLLPRMPWYAWGVGLLAPFALLLIGFRLAIDQLLKRNPQCGQLVNTLAGGAIGLFSGILTAGLTLIGLGFMPLGPDVAGYQPYIVDASGQVIENPERQLWILPVDRIAGDFFSRVSGGAFAPMSGMSMALYQPDLKLQSALFRLHRDDYDPNASPAATPKGVTAQGYYAAPFPDDSLDPRSVSLIDGQLDRVLEASEIDADKRLIVAATTWTRSGDVGTYDKNTLRVFPTQIRLLAFRGSGTRAESRLFEPVGVNWESPSGRGREFLPFNDNRLFPWSANETAELDWVFVIPAEYEPQALIARRLRLPLRELDLETGQSLTQLVGTPGEGRGATTAAAGTAAPTRPDGFVGTRSGPNTGTAAAGIEVTDQLPMAFSTTRARGLEYNENRLVNGDATVSTTIGRQEQSCRQVFVEGHLASARLLLTREQAQTLIGEARARAAALSGIWLVDNQGEQWYPSGYVLVKGSTQMIVKFNRDMPIRSGGELPTRQMTEDDSLYLYFFVKRDIRILKYQLGNTVTDVSLIVP